MTNILIIYAAVFITTIIVVDLLIRTLFRGQKKKTEVNYRLELLKRNVDQEGSYIELLKKRRLNRDETILFSNTWFSKIYTQSGLKFDLIRTIFYPLAALLVIWAASGLVISNQAFRIGLSVLVTPVILLMIVMFIRTRRITKFVGQLANALDIMVRSLDAGHPLPRSLVLVANEMPDPLGSEFGILSDELTYGIELEDGMVNMIHRVGAEELKLLTISMSVQRGTGGGLSEILENLSKVVRDRTMMKAKIKAISAEGRIAALIMAVFPFILYVMISSLAPNYFDALWESGYGSIVITICAVLITIGSIILYRLVKFDF